MIENRHKRITAKISRLIDRLRDNQFIITMNDSSRSFRKSFSLYLVVFWFIAVVLLIASTTDMVVTYNRSLDQKLVALHQKEDAMSILNDSIEEQLEYITEIKNKLDPLETIDNNESQNEHEEKASGY